jgi:hypothetical protein
VGNFIASKESEGSGTIMIETDVVIGKMLSILLIEEETVLKIVVR